MFKDIQRVVGKLFSSKFILVLIISFVIVWGLMTYNGQKLLVRDLMEDGTSEDAEAKADEEPKEGEPKPAEGKAASGYALQPVANPIDLLPNDKNSEWKDLNPASVSDEGVKMPDMLEAGYHIGLDTIGQSMKNANLQLRAQPPVPKVNVGPWNQSTIEADTSIKDLGIGN